VSDPTASGADLARQALAAARAAAKTRPAEPARKTRRMVRDSRTGGRDPIGLGGILERLTAEQGWKDSIGGGELIDQWTQICPTELATTVQPVGYDAEHGLLTLRPSSAAYATQVRLFERQLAKHLNDRLGRPAVRKIRVLSAGAAAAPSPAVEETTAAPAPVRTRETASPGYRRTFEAHQAARASSTPTDPRVADAIERQNQVLTRPANREPETAFTDAVAELERLTAPTVDRAEQIRRAAIARKRGGGDAAPVRRAFDVA
jgi:predicted nucleic acid-binding Zn ribbon protein